MRRLRPRGFKRVNRSGTTVVGQGAAVVVRLGCQCHVEETANLTH
jgi:hypothetical protein